MIQTRTTWTVRLAAALLLVALGFGAFFLSRATLAKDQEAQANPAPAVQSAAVCPNFTVTVPAGPTPRPPPPCATAVVVTVCPNFTTTVPAGATPLRVPPCVAVPTIIIKNEAIQTVEADGRKPGFFGQLNGITFYDPRTFDILALARSISPSCTGINYRYATDAEGKASPLDFTPRYLPPGTEPERVWYSACETDITAVQKTYLIGRGGSLSISRLSKRAATSGGTRPLDRLQAATIAGRPAVIGLPVFEIASAIIYLRGPGELWEVTGRGLGVPELIKIAEGLP